MVSAPLYFHLNMVDLQRLITVLSLFKHFLYNHGASDGMDLRWWVHGLSYSAVGFLSSGVTECTKLFLYFRHLFTGS